MQIQSFSKELLPQALDLLAHSDSTPRTQSTWEGNSLQGVCAMEGADMLGIIPLEPRLFKINTDQLIPVMWITGAHVQPQYRSQGIGAMMDHHIAKFYPEALAVMAYRQDEETRAYQWYMKIGYKTLCEIRSYKKTVVSHGEDVVYDIHTSLESIQDQEAAMLDLFEHQMISWGGYHKRTKNFWSHLCAHHYYKHAYTYILIIIKEENRIQAYAFAGITDMRDGIKRLEILELVVGKSEAMRQQIFRAFFDVASKNHLHEVRIQCALHDPMREWVEGAGFELRWTTNIIGKELQEGSLMFIQPKQWKYFQIDYI